MTLDIQFGQIIGNHYRIDSLISMGSYGIVYRVWHEHMNTPRAIKVVDIGSTTPSTVKRIKRECEIGGKLAQLGGVVQVHDALEYPPYLLIVMEYMAGGDLAKRLHIQKVPFPQALNWALSLCDTLEQVHAEDIIHRDIKPQNILLDSHDTIKLADFGIAHINRSHLTTDYQPGTPAYKAPELDDGAPATAAVDVYSLCAVLFELWNGGYQYSNYKAMDASIVRPELLEYLAQEHPTVDPQCHTLLADALLGGLARQVAQRSSIAQLRNGLLQVQHALEQQPAASTTPAPSATHPKPPVHPTAPATTIAPLTNPHPHPTPSAFTTTERGSHKQQKTAVIEWLVQDIEHTFQEEIWRGTRRTIFFWYDVTGEWTALIPYLQQRLPLIVDQGSLLEMRYALEQRGENEPAVLYLRHPRDQIDYLVPYRVLAREYDHLNAYDLLRRHNVPLTETGQVRQTIQPLLPQLLVASLGEGEYFWQDIRDYDDVRRKLLGDDDFQEQLFRFLATPAATWNDLHQQNRASLFQEHIEQEYGYAPAQETEPATYARGLLAHWCLVDLFTRFDQPDDFPLRDALPTPATWSNCLSRLRALRHDRRYQATVVQMTREIEQTYQGLVEWARQRSDTVHDAPLPSIARIAWERILDQIAACQSREEIVALLRSQQATFAEASQGFWAHQGTVADWTLLLQGTEIILHAEDACQTSRTLSCLADMIAAYTEEWSQIDLRYAEYRATPASETVVAPLTPWVKQSYHRYVEQVNRTWTSMLSDIREWPPASTPPFQTSLWSKFSTASKERQAVFFVDALRYDLACAIQAELAQDETMTVVLDPCFASLPTVTPLGMAALLPQAETQQVQWNANQDTWLITAPDSKSNLAEKDSRRTFLEHKTTKALALNLHELPSAKLPDSIKWLFVFAQDIDQQGETSSPIRMFETLSTLVYRLVQSIRKVLAAGFTAVHLVTDHGFLLLERVAESDKCPMPAGTFVIRKQRYVAGANLPEHPDLLRFPLRGSDDLWAYYPHGIAAFVSPGPYQYSHGGPSLHEAITPYLTVRQVAKQQRVRVKLVMAERIENAIFPIELKPVAETLFDLEREVRIIVEREDGTRLQKEYEEVVSHDQSVKKNISLSYADKIAKDSQIVVILQDATTGEELDRKTALFCKELDF